MSENSKRWWESVPWSECSRGRQIGMIAGWVTVAIVLMIILLGPDEGQNSPAAQAEVPKASVPSAQPQKETIKHTASSAEDVAAFVADLDSAINASESALRRGDLKSLHEHSKRMNQLKSDGEQFGSSIFDSPFGRCFGAGISAQSWWSEQLSAAQRGGVESYPGSIAHTWKEYQENRSECLQAAKGGGKKIDTEQIASTSETPPRKGCLKVLGVRSDGQVGTVAYTCPKRV